VVHSRIQLNSLVINSFYQSLGLNGVLDKRQSKVGCERYKRSISNFSRRQPGIPYPVPFCCIILYRTRRGDGLSPNSGFPPLVQYEAFQCRSTVHFACRLVAHLRTQYTPPASNAISIHQLALLLWGDEPPTKVNY